MPRQLNYDLQSQFDSAISSIGPNTKTFYMQHTTPQQRHFMQGKRSSKS